MEIDPKLKTMMVSLYSQMKADPRWPGSNYCIAVCQTLKDTVFPGINQIELCGDALPIVVDDHIINLTDADQTQHSDLWICQRGEFDAR